MEVTKMQLLLNIYDPETKLVVKQYKAETVNIMFGTIEDIIDIVDIDKLDDNMELLKILMLSMKKLKPLLKSVFIGLTDEELKNTSVKELIPLFKDIIKFLIDEINGLGNGSKK